MCCRDEKLFLVETKQTGAGSSRIHHIASASLSESNPTAAAGTVRTLGLLLLSFSVIFCFPSLPVSFIQAKLRPYENSLENTDLI